MLSPYAKNPDMQSSAVGFLVESLEKRGIVLSGILAEKGVNSADRPRVGLKEGKARHMMCSLNDPTSERQDRILPLPQLQCSWCCADLVANWYSDSSCCLKSELRKVTLSVF